MIERMGVKAMMVTHDSSIGASDWEGNDPDDEPIVRVINFDEVIGYLRGYDHLSEVFEKAPQARLEPDSAHERRCYDCGEKVRMARSGWRCPNGHSNMVVDKDGIVYHAQSTADAKGMGILEESDYQKPPFQIYQSWFRDDQEREEVTEQDWREATLDDSIHFRVEREGEVLGYIRGANNLSEAYSIDDSVDKKAILQPDKAHGRRCMECGSLMFIPLDVGGWVCSENYHRHTSNVDRKGVVRSGIMSKGIGTLDPHDLQRDAFVDHQDWFDDGLRQPEEGVLDQVRSLGESNEHDKWEENGYEDEVLFRVRFSEESASSVLGFVRGYGSLKEVFDELMDPRLEPDPAHQRRCYQCGELQYASSRGWTCPNDHRSEKGVDRRGIVYHGFTSEGMGILEESDYDMRPFREHRSWFQGRSEEGIDSFPDRVKVFHPDYDGPVGRTEDRPLISSVKWYRDPGHHRIVVFNRGGNSGELSVREQDGEATVCRLMGVADLDELQVDPIG